MGRDRAGSRRAASVGGGALPPKVGPPGDRGQTAVCDPWRVDCNAIPNAIRVRVGGPAPIGGRDRLLVERVAQAKLADAPPPQA